VAGHCPGNAVGGGHGAYSWRDVLASVSSNLYLKREEGDVEENAVKEWLWGILSIKWKGGLRASVGGRRGY
jgi:hypothetical protein